MVGIQGVKSSSSSNTRLHGAGLTAARAAWIAVAALNVALLLIGIPIEYRSQLALAASGLASALSQLGLSAQFYAVYHTTRDALLAGAFLLTGLGIFSRKSDDWMVMLISMTSLAFGILLVPTTIFLVGEQPGWQLPVSLLRTLGLALSVVVPFYLLPDGRFVPRGTRWLALGWVVLTIGWLIFPAAPANLVYVTTWGQNLKFSVALYVFWYTTGVAAQVYRYRKVSGPDQRQQTKWVVLGTTAGVLGFVLFNLPLILNPVLDQPGVPGLLYGFIAQPVYNLMIALAPISLGFSVLRYRLWDVDVLINRSLVYGILTFCLALIYLGSVILLRSILLGSAARQSSLVTVISTLAIAWLFNPLRQRIQNGIDRRFFRRKYDTEKILAAFRSSMREEVDLDRLTGDLMDVIEETIQPSSVLLWLRNQDEPAGFYQAYQIEEPGFAGSLNKR